MENEIVIKLVDPELGRNRSAFYPFIRWGFMFKQLGIHFVTGGTAKYTFIGPETYSNRKLNFDDSVNYGLDNVSKHSNVMLFDSSDSTSLLGSYEVLSNSSNVLYLFKNQLLSKFDMYEEPTPFNKSFFPVLGENDFLVGYKIPEKYKSKILLSGWNLGYMNDSYHYFVDRQEKLDVDVAAIFQHNHDYNMDFNHRNDLHYNDVRTRPLFKLQDNTSELNIEMTTCPKDQYYDILKRSKLGISPYGMGEICYRDFELMQFGVPMIKPDMSHIETFANYIPNVTYIPVHPDYSNLNEVIDEALANYEETQKIAYRFRNMFRTKYLTGELVNKWVKILRR